MFITITDIGLWPFLINYSPPPPPPHLTLIPWRSAFEYCAQVFPWVHTLEDGTQTVHPIIFLHNHVFLFFYCFICHNSKKSKLGGFCVRTSCYMVHHHTFCCFFQFASDLWFLQWGSTTDLKAVHCKLLKFYSWGLVFVPLNLFILLLPVSMTDNWHLKCVCNHLLLY